MHFYTFLAGRPGHSLTNTEAFATMLGQELVTFQLQSQMSSDNSRGSGGTAPATPTPSHVPITNGVGLSPYERGTSPTRHLSPPAAHSHSYRSTASVPPPPPEGAVDSSIQRVHSITRSETVNCQVLDTADVSQRIREILSTHNIGQRLFAKHVLGLSQGTVSELLSKPKHWDKLTEKGRESYRKMHAWATDEGNVTALKAISPKKGMLFLETVNSVPSAVLNL